MKFYPGSNRILSWGVVQYSHLLYTLRKIKSSVNWPEGQLILPFFPYVNVKFCLLKWKFYASRNTAVQETAVCGTLSLLVSLFGCLEAASVKDKADVYANCSKCPGATAVMPSHFAGYRICFMIMNVFWTV